ncbi:MAG: hypothetical protein ACTHN7_06160 [Solirubrobacterales bacterium]
MIDPVAIRKVLASRFRVIVSHYSMFFGRRQLAGLGLVVLLLAGCGGGGGGSETTETLTKAQFVAQANKICAQETEKAAKEIEAYAEKRNLRYRDAPKSVYEEEAEEVFVPAMEHRIAKLQTLGAPAADKQTVAKIFTAAEAGMKKGEAAPFTFLTGKALAQARKLSTEYGLKECF